MKNYIKFTSIVIIFTVLFISCSDNDETLIPSIPSIVESTTTSNTTFTSVDVIADVSLSGTEIIARGICWSENFNPTITDSLTVELTNQFTSSITDLRLNTTYYYRVYVTTSSDTIYGQEQSFSTRSFDNSEWIFDTEYLISDHVAVDFSIISKIEFYDDGTTKFDELDYPGVFTAYGTWSLEGNNLTYIFDSTDPSNPIYVYTGVINGNTMSGEYSHSSLPIGEWTAELQ